MFRKHKWLSLIVLLAVLLVLAIIALSLIPGRQSGVSILKGMFSRNAPKVTVNELNFDIGRNRVFAYSQANGAVAAAGTLGFQVLGPDGRETLRDSYRTTAPALTENNGLFIAFDIGGKSIRIFNNSEILYSFEAEGTVVSASINKSGWFCVVTQEQLGGSRGTVSVYNNSGRMVYQVTIGSSFVLSAILSNDNTNLAILGIAQSGSVITLYTGINTDKDDPDRIINLGSEVFLEIDYLSNSTLLAYGERSVLTVNILADEPVRDLYNYGEKRLGGYTRTDEFIALLLYDNNIGYSGQVLSLDFDGVVLGQFETFSEIASIDSCEDTLMLLNSDGLSFYDKYLVGYPLPYSSTAAAAASAATGRVLALGDDMALGANDLSAFVVRRDSE